MTDIVPPASAEVPGGAPGKPLSDAARRALAEAAERRAAAEAAVSTGTGEQGGPVGPDPTRYGDWERKGVAIDFS
jgi:hypothetical protein